MGSAWNVILLIAAAAGFFVSAYVHHKKTRNEKMVCYLGQDCDRVIHSQYAWFLGVPVEMLGLLYYGLVVAGYGLVIALPLLDVPAVAFTLLAMTATAFLFTLYLISLQAFTIKQWCTWCLISAGLCTVIFVSALTNLNHDFIIFLGTIKPLLLILHLIGMAVGLGAATIADLLFFRFLRDFKISEFEADALQFMAQIIWVFLGLAVLSGFGLYLSEASALNNVASFLVKAIAVVVIIVNGFVLNFYASPRLIEISFGQTHPHQPGELHHFRKLAFALGGISLVSWYTAMILGSLGAPLYTFSQLLAFYLLLLGLGIIISQLFEHHFSKKALEL